MANNYVINLLSKELTKTQDAIEVLNTLETGTSSDANTLKELHNRIAHLKYSIKTLQEVKGFVVTQEETGSVTFISNGNIEHYDGISNTLES